MQLHDFFSQLGLNKNETDVFVHLYQLWPKPASTISKFANIDRTTTYKILMRLHDLHLVRQTIKQGVKYFFVPDLDILKSYIHQKQQQRHALESARDDIASQITPLQPSTAWPKISFFEGTTGVENAFLDVRETTHDRGYLGIKFFASNTFETSVSVKTSLQDYAKDIFDKFRQAQITVETYLGNGFQLMETIQKTTSLPNIFQLPAGNSAINVFIVWSTVYFILYKDLPIALKIESDDIASLLHFLFDHVQTE